MSWHINLGYNSQSQDEDAAWAKLKELARRIANEPWRIEEEAQSIDPAKCDDGDCEIHGYASNYALPFDSFPGGLGHPISIKESDKSIIQWASTGCDVKYSVRRAFIRLLMEAAHRERIEISIHVG